MVYDIDLTKWRKPSSLIINTLDWSSVVFLLVLLKVNVDQAILLNNLNQDHGAYQHLESLIRNMNTTIQAMNSTIEKNVKQMQQSK